MALTKEQKAEFDENLTEFKNYIEELKKDLIAKNELHQT